MTPKRVQMSRQHPWRAEHPDAVVVARPSKWGNPCRWWPGPTMEFDADGSERRGYTTPAEARAISVNGFRQILADPADAPRYPSPDEIRAELAGYDLACWCPLDQPCHADVLLDIANGADR